MESFHIETLDYYIIALYFVTVFAIGLYVAKRTKTDEDLFLAGRSLGFFSIGFSLFASNISSTTLIGLSGAAYKEGIAVSNYEWMAGVVLVFMSFFYIPIYLNSRLTTIPEFLLKRFGGSANKYFSAITILLSIIVDTAGGLYAGALVLKTFFPTLDIASTCVVLALVTGLYTAAGGLKAVVYTDVIQAIVLITGCFVLSYLMFERYNFDWGMVKASVPADHLSLIRPLNDSQLPWLGTLIGVPVLGFWYWATNQYITQRILGAKSITHARWGANLAAALKLLPLFIMVIPGAMAINQFPNLENPDMVFPTLVANVLPVGLTGLVMSGLVAAIMSSIDSTLNSASTLIVHDFILSKKPDLSHPQLAKYGRITTVVLMIVAALWAPWIANFGGLFAYLQQSYTILVPPIAVIFLMGAFTKIGGKNTSLATLVVGHLIGLGFFVCGQLEILSIHFTIVAGVNTLISLAVYFALAKIFDERDIKVEGFLVTSQTMRPETPLPWFKDFRYQGYAILTLTLIMVWAFF